jgi:thymidylate synthase
MKVYLDLVQRILNEGVVKENRTGVDAITVPGAMLDHDMADGFPLLTSKFVPFRLVASELEFFIRGITDKQWLQDRNNHIWDEWARQDKVPYGHSEEQRAAMMAERDLGPIYGWQWRNFGAKYVAYDQPPQGHGIDQLQNVVDKLKTDPSDRRMIVSAWNPVDKPMMGLPPCHFCWQVTVVNGKLNLLWNIRSVDVALGMPFNIASYALLLHLLAKHSGFAEGHLVGFCADTHIYVNHVDGLKEQLARDPYPLPTIETEPFSSIFNWEYTHSKVVGYQHHPKIKFDIAV